MTPAKEPRPPEESALLLIADLLDKQIVDVDGRKVVRINDLEIARAGDGLRVVAADVGVAGLLRRLGLKSFGKRFTPAIYRRIPRSMIAWDSVAPIRDANPTQVNLSITESKLARLHPSELAEIISDLSAREAAAVVSQLDDETAADAFEHLDADTQRSLIEDIGTERAADIIEEMDADDAADLLSELDEEQQHELLSEMNEYTASELRALVKYAEDSAGGLMTTDYTWIYPHRTAEATIRKIREIAPTSEFIYYLYVVDKQDTLLGVLTLRALLLADPQDVDRFGHGDRPGEHPSGHEFRRRRRNDRAVRSARRAGRRSSRQDARHRDRRRRDRRDHARRDRAQAAEVHCTPPFKASWCKRRRLASPSRQRLRAADRPGARCCSSRPYSARVS